MAPNDHTSKLKAKAKANEAFKHQNTPDVRTKDPPEAETKELTPSETKGTSTTKDTSKATDTTQSEPRVCELHTSQPQTDERSSSTYNRARRIPRHLPKNTGRVQERLEGLQRSSWD
ncbi:hypothetical protein BO86DRAFT_378362 [Aspergillus japonicus CBS 114.51]|uniref:Uncharacterized protein n=1 Tax=Aspergillus japonicus CBS 114.51 TaxID=1448312 RepID=A0A8T8X412_ASPJA|nr:hypothetical protein BO86DRAFT_378362 [Aspergillus japonicus CBS 114.51]RAH82853.1 hypothetical protein BO86DRAFT_378362 [Aspergillus japonicus CBS 114.51]